MPVSAPSRLTDLHLPDMPERPTLDLPEFTVPKTDFTMPKFEMPDIDVPKAFTAAATAVGLVKPARPRWPYALGAGLLLAAGAAIIALNWESIRARLSAGVAMAQEQIAQMRSERNDDEPVAFTAAETASQRPSETTGDTGADYPDGLGTKGANGTSTEDATASEAYVGV